MSETTDKTIHVLVVGVGGSGVQAVNNIRVLGLDGVKFAILNENDEGVYLSVEENTMQVEDRTSLHDQFATFDIVFVVADMGEDFGAEYASRIGFIAKEKGALTIGVVTGSYEEVHVVKSGHHIVKSVDTLITIPDQSFDSSTTDNPSTRALLQVVRAILDTQKSTLTVDLADISFSKNGGLGMFGEGNDLTVEDAAMKATRSPLLGTASVASATSVLVTITGPSSVNFLSVHSAVQVIMREAPRCKSDFLVLSLMIIWKGLMLLSSQPDLWTKNPRDFDMFTLFVRIPNIDQP